MKQRNKNIPFMLDEPVKTEYRGLKPLKDHPQPGIRGFANALEIYTPGNERLSPVRMNPLERTPGISLDEHIENRLGCFMAAMPVSGPLPALLLESLEKVCDHYPDPNWPPMMADLVEAMNAVLASKGYSPETNSNIRAALEVRIGRLTLGSIGKIFQCRHSIPSIEHLMTVPSIFESNRLSPEQACLLILFKLNGVREKLRVSPAQTDRPISYVFALEEAHVIMGRTTDAKPSEDNPDAKAHATEFICRMLAELRAYKVGIIIIDQLPSAIAPEVIKITGTKLAFLQVDAEDRQVLGSAMLFGDVEMEDIARLPTGDAFFFPEGYFRARRIRTVNLHEQFDLNSELSDDELLAYIREEQWFKEAAANRISTELDQVKDYMDRFDRRKNNIGRKVKNLLKVYEFILEPKNGQLKKRRLAALVRRLRALKRELITTYSQFMEGPYRRYSQLRDSLDTQDSDLNALVESLDNRFESVTKAGTRGLLGVIDRVMKNCVRLNLRGG